MSDPTQIDLKRRADGTFAPGFTGNSTGRAILSRGQKIVRDFAVECLPDILRRLRYMYESEDTPIDLRVKIMFKMIDRGAGKDEDAPLKDESGEGGLSTMSGQKVFEMLNWLMEQDKKSKERENES